MVALRPIRLDIVGGRAEAMEPLSRKEGPRASWQVVGPRTVALAQKTNQVLSHWVSVLHPSSTGQTWKRFHPPPAVQTPGSVADEALGKHSSFAFVIRLSRFDLESIPMATECCRATNHSQGSKGSRQTGHCDRPCKPTAWLMCRSTEICGCSSCAAGPWIRDISYREPFGEKRTIQNDNKQTTSSCAAGRTRSERFVGVSRAFG